MKQRAAHFAQALRRFVQDESGQAMTEYISITTLMLFGSMAAGAAWPFSKVVFQALQAYINFFYYSLNIAVG